MKLKYYLRGLGIGIVVAVCITSVSFQNRKPMTDEEIKARAAELGMIENSVLTDIGHRDDNSLEDKPTDTENPIIEPEQDIEKEQVVEPEQEENTQQESTQQESTQQESTQQEGDIVSITVVSGDTSWTVSKRMEEAGLIESAKDFDTHMCRYGYDKKISVGTYKIPVNATHEEMAKILTKSN